MELSALALIAAAYLAGSIPTGVLLARLAGVDVRQEGSGNIGATNVARTAGRGLGILTLVGDCLKGLVPVLVARALGAHPHVIATVAVAALAGHVFSIFLGFRGGKGVATGFGVLIGLAPAVAPIPLAVFIALFAALRIVSLASIAAACVSPVVIWLCGYPASSTLAALAIATLIVWRHRDNIERLLAGTEHRFESRKK